MPIDLKSAITLVSRRYIAPTIFVSVVLAGGMVYVWGEYKELLKEKDSLSAMRETLNNEKSAFEKYRTDTSIELNSKKSELELREFKLQQLEEKNLEYSESLSRKANDYKSALADLQQQQSAISDAKRTQDAEEKISKLMSEFSAMGVDLNENPGCSDHELRERFNTAKAKYSEVYALAEAYGLIERYRSFFAHNGQYLYATCEG